MPDSAAAASERPEAAAAQDWLDAFGAALSARDADAAAALFLTDGHWRDILAFTWNIRTFNGADAIRAELAARVGEVRPSDFRLAEGRTPPRRVKRAGQESLEVIFEFDTAVG